MVTFPNAELDVRAELRKLNVDSYAPQYLEWTSKGPEGRVLFPEYVFVWIDEQRGDFAATRRVKGVIDFVRGTEGVPARVDRRGLARLEELRAGSSEFGYVTMRPSVQAGDRVRVGGDDGPIGLCVGPAGERHRMRVLLEILGRQVQISALERELELAPAV